MSRELSLEINKRCNFSCSFCYTEKYHEDLAPIERVLEIIEEAISLGVDAISMTGGEPLLALERVLMIAAFAKDNGLRTRLNTNGYLLDRNNALEKLLPVIDLFQVSFNADNDQSFGAYTGIGDTSNGFTKVLANIKAIKSCGGSVSIRYTLDNSTAPHLCKVFDLFARGNSQFDGMVVDSFKVRVIVPAGNIDEQSTEVTSVLPAFFDLVRDTPTMPVTFKDGSGRILVPSGIANLTSPACLCGAGSIHISCDLRRVTPCVFVRDNPKYALGELRTGNQSLASVWNAQALSKFGVSGLAAPTVCTAHALIEKDKLLRILE